MKAEPLTRAIELPIRQSSAEPPANRLMQRHKARNPPLFTPLCAGAVVVSTATSDEAITDSGSLIKDIVDV